MLLNDSYNNKKVSHTINMEVGKSFALKDRWAMGGIGSPKLQITACSAAIRNLLLLDNNLNTCIIEMRPKGIIVRFRSLLESYALVIPYYKLSVNKGKLGLYTIHRDHYYIALRADTKAIQKYFRKLLDYKIDNAPSTIGEL